MGFTQDDWNDDRECSNESYEDTKARILEEGKLCQHCSFWWYKGCELGYQNKSTNDAPCDHWQSIYQTHAQQVGELDARSGHKLPIHYMALNLMKKERR